MFEERNCRLTMKSSKKLTPQLSGRYVIINKVNTK